MIEVKDLNEYLKSFPKEIHSWYTQRYISNLEPIVIGGCGRSGTSLLRAMLDSHPDICCGPETNLFIPFLPTTEYPYAGPNIYHDRMAKLAWLYDLQPFPLLNAWKSSTCQAQFVDQFIKMCCFKTRKILFAEKTPKNVTAISYIFQHWPKAKFVHMIRDGRDVVCSLRFHPRWSYDERGQKVENRKENSILDRINRWLLDVNQGIAFRGYPNYYEIKYERLVKDPKMELLKLFDFLKVPFSGRMLEWYKDDRDLIKDPQAEGIDRPLFSSSIGRWKVDLRLDEKIAFKRTANPLLIKLGYVSGASWW